MTTLLRPAALQPTADDTASPNESTTTSDGARVERTVAAERWLDRFTRAEIVELLQFEDRHSWAAFAVNWGLVFASMALVARWPNPLTIVFALFVIAGRQLGMSILMHEASHRTLFKDRRLNDFMGNWLAAYPVWSDLAPYRPYHLKHHAKNWSKDDPDLDLATPFPITRASLRRKIWRDLSGQTGWKRFKALLRRDLGMSAGKSKRQATSASEALRGVIVSNLVLLAILTAFGHPALYLLWFGAWMTTYSLVLRIRAIAEHAMPKDPSDPFHNARTTMASWWERLFLAPNYVNFHLEHHLLMTVPHYKLPTFHRMLRDRGLLANANVAHGYLGVLRVASSKAET
ncbi:MAG TPA: fatty acid desaturase family protein [Candidatus Limnocylindrales bacterium]|jgi:fatty acid desaturase|nr:fatty acid desaturase family protein [Candidatus Limnocylindrales bacterium]